MGHARCYDFRMRSSKVGVVVRATGREPLCGCLSSLRSQTFRGFVVRVTGLGPAEGARSGIRREFPEVELVPPYGRVPGVQSAAGNPKRGGAGRKLPGVQSAAGNPKRGGAGRKLPGSQSAAGNPKRGGAGRRLPGFTAALNAGIRAGTEDFVATLADRVRPEPAWLEELVARALAARQESFWASAVLLAERSERLEGAGVSIRPDGSPAALCRGEPAWSLPRRAVEVLGACACCALYRRRMLDEVGLFDERFLPYESDVDLALRARLAGHRCALVPGARARESGRGRADSPTHLAHRNRVLCLVKSMPSSWLLRRLPSFAFSGARTLFKTPWRPEAWGLLAAKFGVLRHLPRVALERVRVRASPRRAARAEIASFMIEKPEEESGDAGSGVGARPVVASTEESEELELARAQEKIERHRKTHASIRVLDAEGAPVPGARVEVEQTRHDFLFGSDITLFDRLGTPEENEFYKRRFSELFNYAIVDFSWRFYEPVRGEPDYEHTDRVVAWCAEHGIRLGGRALLSGARRGIPRWSRGGGCPRNARRKRVFDIMRRYAGGIEFWEVPNEPGVDFGRACRWVREADPTGRLILNVYGPFGFFDTCEDVLRLLEDAERSGVPFDGVGIAAGRGQRRGPDFAARVPRTHRFPLDHVRWVLDRYAELGKMIHITEFMPLASGQAITGSHRPGVWDEEVQAEYAEKFYRVCFGHPAVKAITWRELGPLLEGAGETGGGLFRRDSTPRPVHAALERLVQDEWRTRSRGLTDASGRFAFSGFHGRYHVRVDVRRKTVEEDVRLAENGRRQFTVRVPRRGVGRSETPSRREHVSRPAQ